MDDLKIFEVGADVGALKRARESGAVPESWEGVFRALVSEISTMVERKPRSIYLCSEDEDAEARNQFGAVLSRILRERIPGTLLVDCDFLSVGLSGVVPHRDALGFLDLLLYGTSLGVITQQAADGTKVVGAGSFAVTKKSPFAVDAFGAARRYLVTQSGCVIFAGPLLDDEGNVHPIVRNVDLAILVRVADRFDSKAPEAVERGVAAASSADAWSVRLSARGAPAPAAERRVPAFEEPTLVAEVEDVIDRSKPESRPGAGRPSHAEPAAPPEPPRTRESGAFEEEREIAESRIIRSRASASRAVRVAAWAAVILAAVFVVWWLVVTRSIRGGGEGPPASPGPAAVAQRTTTPDSAVTGAGGGTPETKAGTSVPEGRLEASGDTNAAPGVERPALAAGDGERPADEPTRAAGDAAALSDSLVYVRELGELSGRYVIHVSSFRGTERAESEAFYLLGWGYPVFVYHVDLGSKGKWYRVYVGPFENREEATEVKIKLDGNPRIQSTRLSKVPG